MCFLSQCWQRYYFSQAKRPVMAQVFDLTSDKIHCVCWGFYKGQFAAVEQPTQTGCLKAKLLFLFKYH